MVLLSQILWVIFFLFILTWRRHPQETGEVQESARSRAIHLILVVIGFAVIWWRRDLYFAKPALAHVEALVIFGFLVQIAAHAYGLWARISMGPNWTPRVRTSPSQRIVVTGPYRMTRHPLDTSIAVAALGTACIVGHFRPYLGFVIILIAYIRKMRLEERLLERRFGDEFRRYRDAVPMFLPTKGFDAFAATRRQKQEDAQREAEEREEKQRTRNDNDRDKRSA